MPKISILGTATPPPYCDCIMDVPMAHYHWAVFVDPSGRIPKSLLPGLCCLADNADDDDYYYSVAGVFDLHGKRLRQRPAIQVSFTAQELPVQVIVAKPGAPQARVWGKRAGLVSAVEKALKDVKSEGVSQDEWVDEAIIKLVEAELLERFNQDDFRRFARQQLGPPILERGDDRDVVKEVDYVEVRRRREGEFGRVQVGGR
jgi:hypothetical protein